MKKLRLILSSIIAIVLLVIWYISFNKNELLPLDDLQKLYGSIDSKVSNIAHISYDQDGNIIYKLHALEIEHVLSSDNYQFKHPIVNFVENHNAWQLTSILGDAHHREINLHNNVVITSNNTKEHIIIHTQSMSYDTTSKIAKSLAPVDITIIDSYNNNKSFITADKLIFDFNSNFLELSGHTTYTQIAGKNETKATADLIIANTKENLITLKGHAKIMQNHNTLSAPILYYNLKTQHVITEPSKTERTEIIIKG
jgi:LPS export ABC transporter protein LptC